MWLRDYENPCMHLNKTYLFGSNNSCSKVLNPAVLWMFLILEDELFWSTFCPKFEMRVLSFDETFFYYWPMISRDRISSSLGYLFECSRIIYFDHPYWLKASCWFSSVRIIYFQSVCILAQISIKDELEHIHYSQHAWTALQYYCGTHMETLIDRLTNDRIRVVFIICKSSSDSLCCLGCFLWFLT